MRDLEARLQSASWKPAGEVGRPFVRYPNAKPSPGMVWHDSPPNGQVTLVIRAFAPTTRVEVVPNGVGCDVIRPLRLGKDIPSEEQFSKKARRLP